MGAFLQGLSQGGETYHRNQQMQATTAYQRALMDQMHQKQLMDAFKFQQDQDVMQRGHQFFAPGQEEGFAAGPAQIVEGPRPMAQRRVTPEPSFPSGVPDPRNWDQTDAFLRSFSPQEQQTGEPGQRIQQGWAAVNQATPYASGVEEAAFGPGAPVELPGPTRRSTGMQPTPSRFEHLAQTQGFDPRTTALVQAAYHLGGPQAASSLMDDIVKQVTAENAASLRGSNMWETRQVQSEDGVHVIQVNKQTGEQREVSKYALKPFAQSDADRMVSTLSKGEYRTALDAAKAGHPEYGEQAFKKLRQDYPTNVIVGSAMDKPLQPSQSLTARMPLGSSLRQAVGKMPLSEVEVNTLQEAEKAKILIEDIEKYALRVPDVKPGLLNRAVGGASNYAKALAQTNQDAYMLTTKHGEMANLARSLGEKGVLTEQDMARVKDLLPLLSDVMAVRKQKLVDLRAIVDKGLAVYVAKLKTNYPQQKELQNKTKSEAEQLYDEERAKAEKEMQ